MLKIYYYNVAAVYCIPSKFEPIIKSVRQYKCFVLTDYDATIKLLFVRFGFTTKTIGDH